METRIRNLREDNDLTQIELSKYLKISQVAYSYYESGKRSIPLELLSKLADFYKTSIDYLLYRIEDLKYEDAPFVALALLKSKKIGKVNKALVYYRVHERSETTVRDERIFDIIKIVDIIRGYFKDYDWSSDAVDTLTIKILVNYNIQQRNISDKKLRDKFIDETFDYFERNIPNYKSNIYFKERNMLKSFIEKNKGLSKLYCDLYRR